ncbi:MAG: hypothetical protein ABIP55_14505 [Tepidisphaeraceae bacterium]
MKRTVRIALALLVVGAGVAVAAVWHAGREGSSTIEQWLAGQIQLVADACLVPKLTFTDLDYQFPATVHLKQLRVTAEDPSHPGKTIDILGAESAELELTEMPRVGQPIRIASIVLKKPLFQAVRAGAGSAKLIGFSQLMKETGELTTQPSDVVTVAPKISGFLQVRHVELVDGKLVSDPRLPGVPPMVLDRINTKMAIEREAGGWYALHTRIAREPVFELSIAGRLNLDTFVARDATVTLKAQVGREHDGYLPSEMQAFLKTHEVQGVLEAKLTGELPLLDPGRGSMEAIVALRDANASVGDFRLPIRSLEMRAALSDGRMKLSSLRVEALRGTAEVTGTLRMNSALDADVKVAIDGMLLDDTIRDGTVSAREPKYGGRMNATINASASLRDVMAHLVAARRAATASEATPSDSSAPVVASSASLAPLPENWGDGRIDIDRGRLMYIPLVRMLGNSLTKGQSLLSGRGGGKGKGTDRAMVVFDLCGDSARCEQITYVGAVFAARGRGTVTFAQAINLIVNAGPLEKMQSLIGGRVGRIFGRMTDALANYRVTGTVQQPRVHVQLAGGSVNRAGTAVKSGMGRAIDAVGRLANVSD